MRKMQIILISSIIVLLFDCNHSRIRFPEKERPKTQEAPASAIKITPKECQGRLNTQKQKDACEEAKKKVQLAEDQFKQKQLLKENQPAKEVVLTQDFFIWGYFPKKIVINAAKVCEGKGILEIYQFGKIKDEVISQITLGMYMPRTLKITCQK